MRISSIITRTVLFATTVSMFLSCSKEKIEEKNNLQSNFTQTQEDNVEGYTLAEMAEVMSWEQGKAFFDSHQVKDYTDLCKNVINNCGEEDRTQGTQYVITWHWPLANGDCDNDLYGLCSASKMDTINHGANVRGCLVDGKLVIVPTADENGFTSDGYLAIGQPIVVDNDTIIIREGIYAAYYDEVLGRYVAVAVDVYPSN